MPPPREKERDPLALLRGHNPRGELSRTQAGVRGLFVNLGAARARSGQRQNLHRRVVVVEHLPLRYLADQLFVGRPDHFRRFPDNPPLRRPRQRHPQVPLQPCQPVEGNTASVL